MKILPVLLKLTNLTGIFYDDSVMRAIGAAARSDLSMQARPSLDWEFSTNNHEHPM